MRRPIPAAQSQWSSQLVHDAVSSPRETVAVVLCSTTGRLLHDTAARLGVGLSNYRYSERRAVIDLILRIKSQRKMAMGAVDAYQLYMAARATRNLPGAAAEVGVFEGGNRAF